MTPDDLQKRVDIVLGSWMNLDLPTPALIVDLAQALGLRVPERKSKKGARA